MGGPRGLTIKTDLPLTADEKSGLGMVVGRGGSCLGKLRGIRHARLSTVATSRVVSLRALFVLRLSSLVFLLFGGVWMVWESVGRTQGERSEGELPPPMLCLPDWSYAITVFYFLMAALACLRQSIVRPFTPHSSVTVSAGEAVGRSFANTATLFLLEISVVFQTIVVPLCWFDHAQKGSMGRATMSTVALGAVLADLFLNQSRIEATHVCVLLAVLFLWAIEQVAWVHSSSGNEACYGAFNVTDATSLWTALVGAVVVVGVVFAYAALCAQRDRLMAQCANDPNPHHTGEDVEEDVGQEDVGAGRSALPSNLRAPPNTERKSIVNPIFAGAGSRINRGWPNVSYEQRTSLASSATEMSSGEDADSGWHEVDLSKHGARTPAVATAPTPDGVGRRGDWGSGSGKLTAHPASWAGYGGAAAWVRSSSRDHTPLAKGTKPGPRRGPPRY